MNTIYKYPLAPGYTTIQVPHNAKVLCAKVQGSQPCLWVELERTMVTVERKFVTLGTGDLFNSKDYVYIDTVLLDNDMLVFHIYEVVR